MFGPRVVRRGLRFFILIREDWKVSPLAGALMDQLKRMNGIKIIHFSENLPAKRKLVVDFIHLSINLTMHL